MHIVYPLIWKAWCNLLALFFDFEDKWKEPFYVRRRYIIAIRTLYERFSFKIKNGNQAGHFVDVLSGNRSWDLALNCNFGAIKEKSVITVLKAKVPHGLNDLFWSHDNSKCRGTVWFYEVFDCLYWQFLPFLKSKVTYCVTVVWILTCFYFQRDYHNSCWTLRQFLFIEGPTPRVCRQKSLGEIIQVDYSFKWP